MVGERPAQQEACCSRTGSFLHDCGSGALQGNEDAPEAAGEPTLPELTRAYRLLTAGE